MESKMSTSNIRHKLYDYIRVAEDRKVKAIYTMLEDEIEETYKYWNDQEFVADLEKRSADYKTGRFEGIAWDDAKAGILSSKTSKKR
ncbi:MAG: hypothetical protein EOO04_30345 [Chitinophagaceae bacterium]|nr:MAG: hypothetical protein EOO04_30345 [Chitinophagaceae bacterium]